MQKLDCSIKSDKSLNTLFALMLFMSKFDIESKVSGGLLSEMILGGQDGVVNVLGITLAVATATSSTKVVLIAALAALFAESISMAAVAYTSTKALRDYYKSRVQKEKWEIAHIPKEEEREIYDIYRKKGFKGELLRKIARTIVARKRMWLSIMITDELGLPKKPPRHPAKSAAIVGFASVIGSLIPIIPFIFIPVKTSIAISIIISCAVLFFAGAFKAKVTIGDWKKSGLEMVAVGISAALAGYVIGYLLGKL